MANTTAEISASPVAGLALYGLLELFLRQPNVAAAVYAFAAIAHIMPQHLPTYNVAAAMVENYFQEPHADDPSEVSQSSGDDNEAQYDAPNASATGPSQTPQSSADYITVTDNQYRSLVALSNPNAWLLASLIALLTWIPLILFFIQRNYMQAHARRQRYFSLIVGLVYAAVVAYLAALTLSVDLQTQWSQLKLAVCALLVSFFEMRHDAKACLDGACSYMGRMFPSPRAFWAAVYDYFLYPIASIFVWLFGQAASLIGASQSAASQSMNASSGELYEGFQDAPTERTSALVTVLSACSDNLSKYLATIFGYVAKIFWIVFHAEPCPECSELYWSKISVMIGTAIVTCACVAQYNFYPHATSQWFVFGFYLAVGLGYLFTLDCTQEIKAAVNTAFIAYPLSCLLFHPDPFMDAVRRAFHGMVGVPHAMHATAEAACTKVMDTIIGRVDDNDWTLNPQLPLPDDLDIWASDSDDSGDEEDLPAPSTVPSVLPPATVVVEEQRAVERTAVAEELSAAQKSRAAAVRKGKQAYQVKAQAQRGDVRLQRAIAETNALALAVRDIGPRPDFHRYVESSSSTPGGTVENIADSSPAEVETKLPEQPSSQLEVPTQEQSATNAPIAESSDVASVPAANEAVEPSSSLPTEIAEAIIDASPAESETVLPALPAQSSHEIEVLAQELAATNAPVQETSEVDPTSETSEPASVLPVADSKAIDDSSLDEVETKTSEHPQQSEIPTVQGEPQEGKSISELTFLTEPVIAAPAPATPPQVPTITVVTASPQKPVIAAPATASSQGPNVAPALAPVQSAEAHIPQTSVSFTNSSLQNTFQAAKAAVLAASANEDNSVLDDGSGEPTTNASKPEPAGDKMEVVEDDTPEPTAQVVAVPAPVPVPAPVVDADVDIDMDDAPEVATTGTNSFPAPAQQSAMTQIPVDPIMPDQTSTHSAGPSAQKPLPSLEEFLSNAPPMPTLAVSGLQSQQQKSAWQFGMKASEPVLVSSTPVASTATTSAINTPAISFTQPQQQNTPQPFGFGLEASQPTPPQQQSSFPSLGPDASQPRSLFGGFSTHPQQEAKPQKFKFDLQPGPTTSPIPTHNPSPIPGLQSTQSATNPTPATQTPGNDNDLTAENLAAAGAVYDDTVRSQESDPSSLNTEARNDTAGILAEYAAIDAAAAEAAAVASTPRSRSPSPQSPRHQSPIESEQDWVDALFVDQSDQLEPIQEENDEDELDFFNQTESARVQSNINNGLSVETLEDSGSDLSDPPDNIINPDVAAAVEPNPESSQAGRGPTWGGAVTGPNTDDKWDGTATNRDPVPTGRVIKPLKMGKAKQDPAPADRVIKPMKKGNLATPAPSTSPGFRDTSTAPAAPPSRGSPPSTPMVPFPPPDKTPDVLTPADIQAAITGDMSSRFAKYSNMYSGKAPKFGAEFPSHQIKPLVPNKSLESPSYANSSKSAYAITKSAPPGTFSPMAKFGDLPPPPTQKSPSFTGKPLTGPAQGPPYPSPGFKTNPWTPTRPSASQSPGYVPPPRTPTQAATGNTFAPQKAPCYVDSGDASMQDITSEVEAKDTSMQDIAPEVVNTPATPNPTPAPVTAPKPGDFYTYATQPGGPFRVKYAPNTQRMWFTDEEGYTQYWCETQNRWLLSKDGGPPVFAFRRCVEGDGEVDEDWEDVGDEPDVEGSSGSSSSSGGNGE